MTILLIGLGNPLRRDDGVGYKAALELQDQGYKALALTQPLPELVLQLAKAREVIFLDADLSSPPGTICLREAKPTLSQANHTFTPEGLLALAQYFGPRQAKVKVLSLGVEDLGLGEGFSPKVQAAFPEYLYRARTLLEATCMS